MRIALLIALFVLPGSSLVTQAAPVGSAPGVSGSVSTYLDAPVSGVSVFADRAVATTGADGRYVLSLPPGAHTLIPVKAGWTFTPQAASVTVSTTGLTRIDFAARSSGGLTGRVSLMAPASLKPGAPSGSAEAITFAITGIPDAQSVCVHLQDVGLQRESSAYTLALCDRLGRTIRTFDGLGPSGSVLTEPVEGPTAILKLAGAGPSADQPRPFKADYCLCTRSGIRISAAPSEKTATTDTSGRYDLPDLAPGYYTIRPVLPGWSFFPTEHTARVMDGAITSGVDFIGQRVVDRR